MKKKIVISINPEHVENIINGKKKYEYRRFTPKKDVSSIIIYETTPVKMVVAEAEIVEVIMLSPDELWKRTKNESGITKKFFDEYFIGKNIACAYKLGKIKVYDTPKQLIDFGIKFASQSFVYV